MRVYLSHDEYYPLFHADERLGDGREEDTADLSEAEVADYRRACGEFYAWQRKLRALYRWDEMQN